MSFESNIILVELANLVINPNDIKRKRKKILEDLGFASKEMKNPFFTSIGENDVQALFYLYDKVFFKNFFKKYYANKFSFRVSQRLTSAGGKTTYNLKNQEFIISISSHLLLQSFSKSDTKARKIKLGSGICVNRLEAFAAIMEHEIIHTLELLAYKESSCSAARFKTMAFHLFSHTEFKHQLVTSREKAADKGILLGSKVRYTHEGKVYTGIVKRITKRATVMVPSDKGRYSDASGQKYYKVYVPLQMLEKI